MKPYTHGVAGREFNKNDLPEAGGEGFGSSFILNESAARLLGGVRSLGKQVIEDFWNIKGTIIGIVKDFHTESLHESIKPTVFLTGIPAMNTQFFRIDPRYQKESLNFIDMKVKQFDPTSIRRVIHV